MLKLRTALTASALTLFASSALAGITTYGTGCPDSGLTAPTLSLTGQDIPGGLVTMSFDGAAAGSFILIMIGLGQSSIPMGFGCTLNVAPLFPVPFGPLPLDANGNISFSTVIPDTTPAPLTITLQAFESDPLVVPSGFGNTNGVQLDLVPAAPVANHLVINEVDYDQPGTDATEYCEIYNPTGSAISLSGVSCVFVNGNGNGFVPYTTIDLTAQGSIPAGGYLVIANTGVVVAPGAILVNFALATNTIQNGAPDAIVLVDTVAGVCIDAVSYEGTSGTGLAAGVNCAGFEGTGSSLADPSTGAASFQRWPNGNDSNNNAADFVITLQLTPGAANAVP
jgi:Lamin Tail Domain